MTVSIAIATYNGGAYLETQLHSLAAQTRRPDEVVITDDLSTDATAQIAARVAEETGLNIRFHRNDTRLNVAGNFNAALGRSTGDTVFFCDQDDAWDAGKIATVLTAFAARPDALCVMNDARFADGDLQPTGRTKRQQMAHAGMAETDFTMGCCAAFRRPLVDLALPIPPGWAHDVWVIGLADALRATHRIDAVLQDYRIHGGNVTGDVFINRSGDKTRAQMWRHRLGRIASRFATTANLAAERDRTAMIVDRLNARAAALRVALGPDGADAALTRLRRHLQILTARDTLRARPRLRRLGPVLRLWRQGAYGSARGAIKDLFVARTSMDISS